MNRCSWAKNSDYIKYHDTEHGVINLDTKNLFERLVLELFSTGLSFSIAYKKKDNIKNFFKNYNLNKIVKITNKEIEEILQDEGIIRHEKKILAVINNAQMVLEIEKEYGTLWDFLVINIDYSKGFDYLVKDLHKKMKKRDFKFIGTSTIESFISSIGLYYSHEKNCDFQIPLVDNVVVNTPFGYIDIKYDNFQIAESVYHYNESVQGDYAKAQVFSLFLKRKIELYFERKIDSFNLSFNLNETPFSNSVLNEVLNTKVGETLTYKELALRINSKAHRAVGTALSKNKCHLLIPCHRVVAANSIGGFNNQMSLKIKLLKFEEKQ